VSLHTPDFDAIDAIECFSFFKNYLTFSEDFTRFARSETRVSSSLVKDFSELNSLDNA
jgi:hypothetical protein